MNDFVPCRGEDDHVYCSKCGATLLEDETTCPNTRACQGGCGALIHDRGDGRCGECR